MTFIARLYFISASLFISTSFCMMTNSKITTTNTGSRSQSKKPFWISSYEKEIAKSALITKKQIVHPLLRDKNMDHLYALSLKAKKILDQKAQGRKLHVVSLGQSAAWLVFMMKTIDGMSDANRSWYGHIAFSGNFFDVDKDTLDLERCYTPSSEEKKAYRTYFKALQLGKNLKNSYLAIIEFTHCARGIMSFHELVEDLLPQEMTYLITPPVNDYPVPHATMLDIQEPEDMDTFLCDLRNSDKFNDRRVVHFASKHWQIDDPDLFKLSSEAQLLERIIKTYVFHRELFPHPRTLPSE